jgi:N-acetylated-alpha-linked acidic dipeptidase
LSRLFSSPTLNVKTRKLIFSVEMWARDGGCIPVNLGKSYSEEGMTRTFFLFFICAGTLFSQTQREWEEKLCAIPKPENLREYMKKLSAHPHHLGSAHDKENAEWILSRFTEWGLDAHIETFDVLFPTPKERAVELVAPTKFVAKLQEPGLPEDSTSNQIDEQLPTYNAYSIDGDVTAPLVYVNYGVPDDYEKLDRMGISVKGCIVITRYGGSWRGIKPKVAAEHGAIGCLIYSDPAGDGYAEGDIFPKGGYRPPDGVQRGSVLDMPLYPGDPLTPGVGAIPGAKRLAMKDVQVFTKIPVLPLSYADAQPLLAALSGPVAPSEWRGALPITYHIGPGEARVHLKALFNWDQKKIYDVIAKIPGSDFPDEWVIRGNHHDAWVNGAEDPISGQVCLLEEARSFGELVKQGWKPKRTIVYCAWDGEEEGLLGSTEWVETHADELQQKGAVYINSDSNGRGYLYVGGSHTLEKFINAVMRDINDPEKNISVWKRSYLAQIAHASSADDRREIRSRGDLKISALGSGSDFSAFLDHCGIASLNMGFGGEGGGGNYHSVYDDFYYYTHFSDTDFMYGRALAQTVGTAVIRLADAELLPYSFTNFSETVKKYLDELQKLAKSKQDDIRERNKEIEEGVFAATADPKEKSVPPSTEELPPYLNFAPLQNAVDSLLRCAERYDKAAVGIKEKKTKSFETVNAKLIESERKLTTAEGLPGRPWFRHQIYAPGFYTGYGVKTIPAVREAIEQKQWKLAEEQVVKVAQVIEGEASLIDSAATELEKLSR